MTDCLRNWPLVSASEPSILCIAKRSMIQHSRSTHSPKTKTTLPWNQGTQSASSVEHRIGVVPRYVGTLRGRSPACPTSLSSLETSKLAAFGLLSTAVRNIDESASTNTPDTSDVTPAGVQLIEPVFMTASVWSVMEVSSAGVVGDGVHSKPGCFCSASV